VSVGRAPLTVRPWRAASAALLDSQRGVAALVVRDAVTRGELPESTAPDRALDLIVGPLYWRLVVVRAGVPEGYLDELAGAVVAALGARPLP
jgi:hypothetical protein